MIFHFVIIIGLLLAAIIQTWGARLEKRPCKYVKYSYAVSLSISAGVMWYCSLNEPYSMFGCKAVLVLLTFNILLGGTVRLISLLKLRRECACREH